MSTPRTIREDVYARVSAGRQGTAEVRKTDRGTRDPGSKHLVELWINGVRWMTNEVAEDDSHAELHALARGRVLLVGLGLGCDVLLLEGQSKVTAIDAVEISQDVIDLVLPSVTSRKLTVFRADILTWTTAVRYDTVWVDLFLDDWTGYPTEKAAADAAVTPLLARGGQVLYWRHPASVTMSR